AARPLEHVNAAAPGFSSLAPGAAAISFAQRKKPIAALPADGAQSFEASVALLEREIHPSPPLEPAVLFAFVDECLVRAVRVFFPFDQEVEPPRVRAVGDVL